MAQVMLAAAISGTSARAATALSRLSSTAGSRSSSISAGRARPDHFPAPEQRLTQSRAEPHPRQWRVDSCAELATTDAIGFLQERFGLDIGLNALCFIIRINFDQRHIPEVQGIQGFIDLIRRQHPFERAPSSTCMASCPPWGTQSVPPGREAEAVWSAPSSDMLVASVVKGILQFLLSVHSHSRHIVGRGLRSGNLHRSCL